MDQQVTLKDIADYTGVSIGTVSQALNDGKGIASATKQRVLEAARTLGYERTMRRATRASRTITLLVERLPIALTSDPFNRTVLFSLEAAARKAGYRIVVEFVSPEDYKDPMLWTLESTAGVIFLGGGDISREWVQAAVNTGLPIIVLDHFIPDMDVPTVVSDSFAGAYAITQYLIDMGHRRIGFIRGPSKYWTLSERLAGYMLAMQRAGLGPLQELIPPRVSHGDEKGYGEMQMLLDLPDPPTAVFAVSDKTAVGAYRATQERGLSIPYDISIVGFDDIEIAQLLNPPLTTVHTDLEVMGEVAFQRLLDVMKHEENQLLAPIKWTIPTKLVIRKSVRDLNN